MWKQSCISLFTNFYLIMKKITFFILAIIICSCQNNTDFDTKNNFDDKNDSTDIKTITLLLNEFANICSSKASDKQTSIETISNRQFILSSGEPALQSTNGICKNAALGGHAWVIDTLTKHNSATIFHCNWGWDGNSNDWINNQYYMPKGSDGYPSLTAISIYKVSNLKQR